MMQEQYRERTKATDVSKLRCAVLCYAIVMRCDAMPDVPRRSKMHLLAMTRCNEKDERKDA